MFRVLGEEKREIKLVDGDDKQPLVARPPRKRGRQAGCATRRDTVAAHYTPPLCRVGESQFIYAQLPCTGSRVNNEATGCRRPHPRREPSMTDRATLMARITRPVSPSHPPAILWQPTRPTPPNLFFTTPFLKTNRESSAFPPVLVPLFVIRRLGCTEFLLSVFSLFSFFLISISSSRRSPILVALGGLYILRRKLVGGGSGYLIKSRVKGWNKIYSWIIVITVLLYKNFYKF